MARSSFGWETRAGDSRSLSARNADRQSFTSRKGTNNISPSLLGPLRTHAFRPRRSRSTRSAGIRGSPFPRMSRCTGVTRSGPNPLGEDGVVGRVGLARDYSPREGLPWLLDSPALMGRAIVLWDVCERLYGVCL